MKKHFWCMLISLGFLTNAQAYVVSFSTYVPGFLSTQSDSSGSSTKFALNPSISIAKPLNLKPHYFFVPELGFTHHMDTKDGASKQSLYILYPLAYHTGNIMWRGGLATFMDRLSGDGSTHNYNGTFYTPNETQTSYTTAALLGVELLLFRQSSIKFDFLINRPLANDSRDYSYLLGYNIFF